MDQEHTDHDVAGYHEPLSDAIKDGADFSRVRFYKLDARQIIEWFGYAERPPNLVSFPKITGLPKDYQILGVHWDWRRRCFQLTIWSSEFDPIPAKEQAPLLPEPDYEIEVYRLEKEEK